LIYEELQHADVASFRGNVTRSLAHGIPRVHIAAVLQQQTGYCALQFELLRIVM
jgi:hypothetical protein